MKKILFFIILLISTLTFFQANAMTRDEALAQAEYQAQSRWATISDTWYSFIVSCSNWISVEYSYDLSICSPWQTWIYPNCVDPTCSPWQTWTYPNCITTTYWPTTNNTCSISNIWTSEWDSCKAKWNWNSNWTIECEQKLIWNVSHPVCWNISCTPVYENWVLVDNWCWSCDTSNCINQSKWLEKTETKKVSIDLWNTTTNTNNAYANNSDENSVTVSISATTNGNKPVTGLPNKITDIEDVSWLKTNRVDKISWTSPISISPTTMTIPDNFTNSTNFTINWIKSVAPLKISNWKISFKLWWTLMKLTNVDYHFKKPFTWEIEIVDNDEIELWTSNKFKIISIENPSKSISETILDIKNNENNIKVVDDINHKIVSKNIDDVNNTFFEATINTSSTATSIIEPWIKLDKPPIISYKFWWKDITYYLNDSEDWDNEDPLINNNWKEFIWVKIIWSLQWTWKQEITWQNSNFSDISKLEQRTIIRKNAYNNINSKIDKIDQKINWVYFSKNKDIKYTDIKSKLISWDTVVVKDWNFIIDWDITSTIWIIVLKDWYNVNDWYNWNWNVFITPNVTKINWVLYADWWLMSVKSDWTVYTEDNFNRTSDLKKQLILNWSIFTRNTIGWAILAWNNYILPWGKKIPWDDNNFFKAMQYDLNYVRRWNVLCDKSTPANWKCTDSWEYEEYFIIKYDPKVQSNPPKLFEIK